MIGSEVISNPYEDRPLVLREVDLSRPAELQRTEDFLRAHGLRPDNVPEYLLGVYDEEETLLACGGLTDNVIKWLTVDESLRGEGVAARIVTRLLAKATQQGLRNIRVFTRPERRALFESMSFTLIGQSAYAVFLEKDSQAFSRWIANVRRPWSKNEKKGAIVMNANPFTLGHLYLIRRALETTDRLYLFLLDNHELTCFPEEERRRMIQETLDAEGLSDRVAVVPGSHYCISRDSFPSYFRKNLDEAAEAQIEVDLDIFCRRTAPSLDLSCRFVGNEPTDRLTARYNEGMKAMLPQYGIAVKEITRKNQASTDLPISAGKVRSLLAVDLPAALMMLPPASRPYALAEAAAGRLFAELSLTPKPGLVDRADNGAHRDMDFSLMAKSIHALRPYFARLAKLGQLPALPNYDRIAAIGREAEAAMEKTTGGVNTHRGALFSLGLAIIAAARLTASEPFCLTAESLRRTIQQLASGFPQPQATHGAAVLARTRVKGAVAMAREGYTDLFEEWLPYYQRLTSDDAPYRLLLKIMTGLDDTNVIHRVGTERATIVKKEAETLLADFSLEKLGKLNTLYIRENISPGGAADMWSLTTFIAALLPHTEKQNP